MTSDRAVLIVAVALAVGALLAAAIVLRPKGRDALWVGLPLIGAVVLGLLVWGSL
jgi:hypothetical protein